MALLKPKSIVEQEQKATVGSDEQPNVQDWVAQGRESAEIERPVKVRKTTSIVLDEDLLQGIKIFCVKEGIRFNKFIEEAIQIHAEREGVKKE